MLVARVAWLDGQPRWEAGRVAWPGEGGPFFPGPADLARAQRCLNKIEGHPVASGLALGDGAAWLEERRARLELAKQLRMIECPDPGAVVRRAHARDAGAVRDLVRLLVAEAVCLNPVLPSPAAALAACGSAAGEPLRALVADEAAPLPARALAALVLGAVDARTSVECGVPQAKADAPVAAGWLRRAIEWGRRAGLPPHPALVVALLASEGGEDAARRCLAALSDTTPFTLLPESARELLAEGVAPGRLAALAEAMAEGAVLAERVVSYREESSADRRRDIAREAAVRRREAAAELANVAAGYARTTGDPDGMRAVWRFVAQMLALGNPTPALVEVTLLPLHAGLELTPALRRPYLDLLSSYQPLIWDISTLPEGVDPRREESSLHGWARTRWEHYGRPALRLLEATQRPDLVREALDQRAYREMSRLDAPDPELCRLILCVGREAGLPPQDSYVFTLHRALQSLSGLGAARNLVRDIIQALLAAAPDLRPHLLECVLDGVPVTRQGYREDLPLLVREYLPRLIRFTRHDHPGKCACWDLAPAALTLFRTVPEHAGEWLDQVLAFVADRSAGDRLTWDQARSLRLGVQVGAALSDGDLPRFLSVVRASVEHPLQEQASHLELCLSILARFPPLHGSLSLLFASQPHRCARLLARLGLTARLGAADRAPLDALHALGKAEADTSLPHDSSSAWSHLLDRLPELEPLAEAYRRAQALLGCRPDVPPGLRRLVDRPTRLARELAYLERLVEDRPGDPSLAARASNLRTRLAAGTGLNDRAREEARERLQALTLEAQVAAVEQQITACYQNRLAVVAGPLPAEVRFDEDLLNAVLLTSDVGQNRKLLRRLLRAHVRGEREWREQHPANAAFLQGMRERGVDTAAWLASHPRRYPCPGVKGGRVRLHLERDPVRILQMGNYFDTCLSFGNCNSFSTVANACDLNKRVIYAADGENRVVGRKLIGINTDGQLIGYYTYSSLPDEATNAALRGIFRRYAGDYAARCALELGETGTVPRLLAEDWYDDGIVSWDEAPVCLSQRKRSPRHGAS